ncbi:MAG: hypothetical protein Q9207_002197 [Kuettlingeria erythrocarpa]
MAPINGTNHEAELPTLDPATFAPKDILVKDVCVIGGGCSGTYTAIRLQDKGKSVLVVEKRGQLGGHASTYKDPKTDITLDVGVIVFGHLEEVKRFFGRFGIPLKTVPTSLGPPVYVDFCSGETIQHSPPDQAAVGAAFQRYAAQLAKYPELQDGFELTYPVQEDLLLPFGEFVKKHSLDDLVTTIFAICQGYSPLLELSTIYVLKYCNSVLMDTLERGFLMTERNNVGELYQKAAMELDGNVLLSSSVVAMDRSDARGSARLLVKTPSGYKLILATKIVSTVPHKTDHLHGFDLSDDEKSLFAQFFHNSFYAGVLRNTKLPTDRSIHGIGPSNPLGVPDRPGIYALNPSPASGLFQVYYGSPRALSEDHVKADIIGSVQRIQRARGIATYSAPEFAVFENHSPFNMMVSREAIQGDFYKKLNDLQGQRHTYYNGASFHTQDSSVLWQFTERLLPRILAS